MEFLYFKISEISADWQWIEDRLSDDINVVGMQQQRKQGYQD